MSSMVWAQESVDVEEADSWTTSYWQQSAFWLENSRDSWSENMDWLVRGIDRFFAGEEALEQGNKSYIRVQMGSTWTHNGKYIDGSDVKFRLHLPATSRRLSLVIRNEDETKESLEEKSRPSLTKDTRVSESTLTAALEIARTEAKYWKTRFQIGVIPKGRADVFVKASAKRRWELDNYWTMPYKFEIVNYLSDGLEIETELAFERPLKHELYFSARTEVEWAEEDSLIEAAQIFGIKQHLDDRRGVNYQVGFLGEDLPQASLSSAFISVHYRQLLYKDWLYWNVIPELNFPRSDDYKAVASISLRLEVFFQK